MFGHCRADVDEIVGDHTEPDPTLHSTFALVAATVEPMSPLGHTDATLTSGAPFLAVAEPALLLLASAFGTLGGTVGNADALNAFGLCCAYGQNNYRTLGASDVRRVAASPLPFFMKNRLIVFERAAAANADYLIEQDNDRRRRGGGANATLPRSSLCSYSRRVLLVRTQGFTPPLAGSCRFAARIRNLRRQ